MSGADSVRKSGPLSRTYDKDADDPTGTPRLSVQAFLFVALECHRPLSGGARFALGDLDRIEIGRGRERRFSREARRAELTLPDKLISSQHARITREGDEWVLEDLGSRNGTFLEGERVTRATLPERALIEVGGTFLSFHAGLPCPVGWDQDLQIGDSAADGGGSPPAPGTQTLLPGYQAAIENLARVARSTLPVLLLGESGTGKELMARALHELSSRGGAFVALNCGALPATLIEGQLFGHAKGSFSGAVKDEPGLVRASDRGTLFLDEIAELPLASQSTLLRVLQEREVLPIGQTKPVRVDLRVVAATHQRIDKLPASVFRGDLFARLAGFTLRLLPLRARREDVGVLLAALLPRLAPERAPSLTIAPTAGRALMRYSYPLNIRELQQALDVALILVADGSTLEASHLPEPLRVLVLGRESPASEALPAPVLREPLGDRASATRAPAEAPRGWGTAGRRGEDNDALRADLIGHLRAQRGNVSEVARLMGRTRMQIHRWMKRFGVDPATFRDEG